MANEDSVRIEESLDPEDWESMRKLGGRMVDDMMTYLKTVRERPVWKPIPDEVRARLQEPLPLDPQDPDEIYQQFLEHILPHPMGNIHPRFWGWVIGTGTPLGMLAELLAAGMNPNLAGADHAATYVESQVLDWCKEMLGYPAEASGLLVSGGSMANLVGLTVARNTMADFDVRRHGLTASPQRMTFYGSTETHSSNQKAIELLGLGSDSLRQVPVDSDFRIELSALEAAITKDRDAGYQPICVVGCAGTVNTGAIDDLNSLADICGREGLWFHVDGALGALAALSPNLRPLVAGMERADSLAFDMHKWMYIPYEIGCALVRREEDHRRAFSLTPDYLTHTERGLAGGAVWFSDYGVQLSRGFRALKAWMSIKEHGVKKYGRLIQQNVDQARYLADLVDASPYLERLAPVSLNIVCFRFKAGHLDDESLNQLNQELLLQLHESGMAVPSNITIGGKYALRVAITNHRSQRGDFDLLVRE
ncbi:MAG: pyridoxal-dependent decarboxylase, partial [Anaerolineae bacterium]